MKDINSRRSQKKNIFNQLTMPLTNLFEVCQKFKVPEYQRVKVKPVSMSKYAVERNTLLSNGMF